MKHIHYQLWLFMAFLTWVIVEFISVAMQFFNYLRDWVQNPFQIIIAGYVIPVEFWDRAVA